MQNTKTIFLVGAAVMVLSATMIASASAEEFIASKTGKLNGRATTNQEFKTGTGATVVCKEVKPGGEVTQLKFKELATTFVFTACTISGIGTATVSLDDFTIIIFPILGSYLSDVAISASVLGVKCKISIPAGQSVGSKSGELEVGNDSGKLLVGNKIMKIADEITESNSKSLCGEVGEKKEGTYTGDYEIELEGGTLEVK